MMNAILNIGGLALSAWSFAEMFKKSPDPDTLTSVTLLNGNGPNTDGSIPHIALWDENGNRIGQYKGDANGHLGKSSTKTVTINPTQNGGHQTSPEYILIVMQESDAICLSAVVASGNSQQWIWTGDMGYTCYAQWYHSTTKMGDSNRPIKCVWLDSDHSNGIIAKGLSLHMPSFSSDEALVNQYKKDQRRLCQASARMTLQPEPILPDSIPTFFSPPLQYTDSGALKKPDQGIDRKSRGYPDFTDRNIHDTKRNHMRDWLVPSNSRTAQNISGLKNNQPDRLIISSLEGHSARELCEHPNSLGPDFVNKGEKLFCDMESGKLWPLCDESRTGPCFNLDARQMQHVQASTGDAKGMMIHNRAPVKEYKQYEEW